MRYATPFTHSDNKPWQENAPALLARALWRHQLSEYGDKAWEVVLNDPPHLVQVHAKVGVNHDISKAGNLLP
jgi:hypothetical protein